MDASTKPERPYTMNKILFLDVETTGLPPGKTKELPNEDTLPLWPYITQLSAVFYDANRKRILSQINCYVQLPDDVTIPPIVTQITHIDDELCRTRGLPIVQVLQMLYEQYRECDRIVAHNYAFDSRMILAELLRHEDSLPAPCRTMFREEVPRPHQCTMEDNRLLCKIWAVNAKNGSRFVKQPRLSELYERIFGRSAEVYGLHNSIVDTLVCMRCFLYTEYGTMIPEPTFVDMMERCKTSSLRKNLVRRACLS